MTKDIHALTGVRALAAFWVFFYHLKPWWISLFPEQDSLFNFVFGCGYLGVDVFFVLSGYILTYKYADSIADFTPTDYYNFILKRFARIYPVHIFTLSLLLLFYLYFLFQGNSFTNHDRFSLGGFIKSALLVHAWDAPIDKYWNDVSWSVSSEWLVYIGFPLFALLAHKIKGLTDLILILLLAGLVNATMYAVFDYPGNMAYGMSRILAGFAIGCAFARFNGWPLSPHTLGALALLILLTILLFAIPLQNNDYNLVVWLPPIFGVLIFCLSHGSGVLIRVLSSKIMRYLGEVSYSLYLVHDIAITIFEKISPIRHIAATDITTRLAYMAAFIGLVLTISITVHELIEKPCRKKLVDKAATPTANKPATTPAPSAGLLNPGPR
jgi:peptidoglycan/LPS O-acetylase OafA/YrhL